MFPRANKLLSFLLVLLLGLSPIGNAMAKGHVCDPAPEKGPFAEGMTHAEHAGHMASEPSDKQDQPIQNCTNCDSNCCSGGACSANACGGGVAALVTSDTVRFDSVTAGANALETTQPLSERHSPPFRPPQV